MNDPFFFSQALGDAKTLNHELFSRLQQCVMDGEADVFQSQAALINLNLQLHQQLLNQNKKLQEYRAVAIVGMVDEPHHMGLYCCASSVDKAREWLIKYWMTSVSPAAKFLLYYNIAGLKGDYNVFALTNDEYKTMAVKVHKAVMWAMESLWPELAEEIKEELEDEARAAFARAEQTAQSV